jgi:hypothetical protein
MGSMSGVPFCQLTELTSVRRMRESDPSQDTGKGCPWYEVGK